jgi:hypothetical protein
VSPQPTFLFDRTPVDGPTGLLARYTNTELASACRSTVPLLALLKDNWSVFETALAECGLAGELSVAVERTVASKAPGDRPSFTDAMVTSPSRVLAVEAKWTEPRYPVVRKRLARTSPDADELTRTLDLQQNRAFVTGWLDHMRSVATIPLVLDDFQDCVYQMVHRAASACGACDGGLTPALAYLHFSSAELPDCASRVTRTPPYLEDLKALHQLLGSPRDFPFFLIEIPIQLTASFREVETLSKGARETGQRVRSALRDSQLFLFDTPTVHPVSA